MRKKFLEFLKKLGRQGFIVRNYQSRPLEFFYDRSDGKCFAGTRNAQKRLVFFPGFNASRELFYCLGLVALWFVCGKKLKHVIIKL